MTPRKPVSWIAAIVAIILTASAARASDGDWHAYAKGLDTLSRLAVQGSGRVMPLGVYAAGARSRGGAGASEELFELVRTGDPARTGPHGGILLVAPLFPTDGDWLSWMAIRSAASPTAETTEYARLVEAVQSAAVDGRPDEFNARAAELAAFLQPLYGKYGVDTGRVRAEAAFNRLRPFALSALLYLVVGVISWVLVARGAPRWLVAVPVGAAFAANLVAVGFYGYVAGRIPVNNSFEGMLIFSAALGALALASLAFEKSEAGAVMGTLLAAGILFVAEYSPIERGITPPVPALQSLWLQVHVLTCFIAYAAFALSFAAAWVVLVSRNDLRQGRFDTISCRAVLLGFIFLTAGILTGAAWAKQAWGRYWGFDPKETWALVTWLVYAAYLHFGLLSKERRITRAAAAIIGFVAVMFTFLGVNYLLAGLHSYG